MSWLEAPPPPCGHLWSASAWAYAELAGLLPITPSVAIFGRRCLLYVLIGSSPQLSVGPESTNAPFDAAAAIGPIALPV